ncbi:hypothetical protein F4802DRAFT_181616 [Xylaria palmicola]|nr:hypothetical protein F4802DRAFT_181616 [Xylaria palmicola]
MAPFKRPKKSTRPYYSHSNTGRPPIPPTQNPPVNPLVLNPFIEPSAQPLDPNSFVRYGVPPAGASGPDAQRGGQAVGSIPVMQPITRSDGPPPPNPQQSRTAQARYSPYTQNRGFQQPNHQQIQLAQPRHTRRARGRGSPQLIRQAGHIPHIQNGGVSLPNFQLGIATQAEFLPQIQNGGVSLPDFQVDITAQAECILHIQNREPSRLNLPGSQIAQARHSQRPRGRTLPPPSLQRNQPTTAVRHPNPNPLQSPSVRNVWGRAGNVLVEPGYQDQSQAGGEDKDKAQDQNQDGDNDKDEDKGKGKEVDQTSPTTWGEYQAQQNHQMDSNDEANLRSFYKHQTRPETSEPMLNYLKQEEVAKGFEDDDEFIPDIKF